MKRAAVLTALALALFAPAADPARAQSDSSDIVTVDQDRLLDDSQYGQRIQSDHEGRAQQLAQENRQIEASLIAEERTLTQQRADLPADDFRTLADAFDDKVQRIRAEQDAKAAELGRLRDADRQSFLGLIGPILQALVIERGAVVMLDRRVVILSAESIDITVAAIARIDERIGDGSQVTPGETRPAPRAPPSTTDSSDAEPAASTDTGSATPESPDLIAE